MRSTSGLEILNFFAHFDHDFEEEIGDLQVEKGVQAGANICFQQELEKKAYSLVHSFGKWKKPNVAS